MDRWQDISISDASLKAEFITKFFNGDYIDAFTIISNNPQLNTKAFVADTINQIATILLSLENNFQNGVINYLAQQYSNFQNIIDNYNLKGNWSASTIYQIYNFVTYNNIDYLYINLTPSSGNLPTNTDYWVEINIQGEKGAPGLGVNLQYNWSATTPYNALDVVYYNNTLWVARVDNINKIPGSTEEWETLSGPIVSFYNDGDIEISNLSVDIEPVQDLHGYDAPWPAGGGENKFGDYTIVNGYITGTGEIASSAENRTYVIPISAETTYSIKIARTVATGSTLNDDVQIGEFYGDERPVAGSSGGTRLKAGGYVNNLYTATFATGANAKWLAIKIGRTTVTNVEATAATVQLEIGSSVSAVYTPYENICPISGWDSVDIMHSGADTSDPTIYTITLGQTVYGGTLDATNGTLTVDRAVYTITGNEGFGSFEAGTNTCRCYLSASSFSPRMRPNNSLVCEILCDTLPAFAPDYIYRNDVQGISENKNTTFNGLWIGINNSLLTEPTLSGMRAYIAQHPITVCYPIATPVEIQLDPVQIAAISGQTNNVWANTGDVTVKLNKKYWEEFIEFKLASIYTDYVEPSGDSLYNGLIWFEVFNPQNWNYLTNRNYTWSQVNTNNDTWESVDRGDY